MTGEFDWLRTVQTVHIIGAGLNQKSLLIGHSMMLATKVSGWFQYILKMQVVQSLVSP